MPTPVSTHFSIILRVLAFDRNFHPATDGELTVGVIYQQSLRSSTRTMAELTVAVEDDGAGPGGESVRLVPIPFRDPEHLEGELIRSGIDLLYLTPLRAADIEGISRACSGVSVLSATGVPEYVERGVAVGVGSRGGRPSILINTKAAQNSGADFSSELLKLAEIVEGGAEPGSPLESQGFR